MIEHRERLDKMIAALNYFKLDVIEAAKDAYGFSVAIVTCDTPPSINIPNCIRVACILAMGRHVLVSDPTLETWAGLLMTSLPTDA